MVTKRQDSQGPASDRLEKVTTEGGQIPRSALALLIDDAIQRKGLTLEALHRASGIPISTFSAYRTGKISGERTPRKRLAALAEALDLPAEDVLEAAGARVAPDGDGSHRLTATAVCRLGLDAPAPTAAPLPDYRRDPDAVPRKAP